MSYDPCAGDTMNPENENLIRESLDRLAIKHGTDKSSLEHGYTRWYEQYLAPWRDKPIKLLELGVWNGASLRMWRDYFTKGTIIGLDNARRDVDTNGCIVAIGEQDSKTSLDALASMFAPFSVIIDDASHISSKTIRSFELLWPHLAPGGLYVIEDLQTSYDVVNYGTQEASANPDHAPRNFGSRYTAMQFCQRLADEVNRGLVAPLDEHLFGYKIASVQFMSNICFIVKAG